MIQCDPRAGSKELIPILQSIGAPVEVETLVAGDFAFSGRGEDDRPVPIGIEYKTIADLMACITGGRFSDVQLPGLLQAYEHSWLLVEGLWRPDEAGKLLLYRDTRPTWGRKTWGYGDIVKWLTTMEMKGGIHIARTSSKQESAYWVKSHHSWWTSKAWEDHDAHRHHSGPAVEGGWIEAGLVERWAACLPGIGPKRARNVVEVFDSPLRLAQGTGEDWVRVEGIGPKTAEKVVKAIRGE